MDITVGQLLVVMGIPSAITGLLIWWLKRHIDKKEKAREKREQNTEKLLLMMLESSRANNILSVATAKAVQRIPDAKCNGDMTAALAQAAEIQNQEKEFLMQQGIQHIFEAH